MINITQYHWIWYLLGFMIAPRLTFMIWLSLYFSNILPLPLFIIGWTYTIVNGIKIKIGKTNAQI